jgi:transcriptional regulator with XRE-family HTH domain
VTGERLEDDAAGPSQPALGERLRAARVAGGWSLSDVAAATGMSASFLSQVENGRSDITFTRVVRLVNFYGIDLHDLVPDGSLPDEIVVRGTDQRLIRAASGVELCLLSRRTDRLMLPQLVVFEPHGQTLEYARHAGEEFAFVLAGSVEIDFSGSREPVVLGEGDSAYFDARLPHIYRNTTDRLARLVAVCTPPIVSSHAPGAGASRPDSERTARSSPRA